MRGSALLVSAPHLVPASGPGRVLCSLHQMDVGRWQHRSAAELNLCVQQCLWPPVPEQGAAGPSALLCVPLPGAAGVVQGCSAPCTGVAHVCTAGIYLEAEGMADSPHWCGCPFAFHQQGTEISLLKGRGKQLLVVEVAAWSCWASCRWCQPN